MNRSSWLLIQISFLATLGFLLAATGCVQTTALKDVVLVKHDDALELEPAAASGPTTSLRSRWVDGNRELSKKATIVMVPGSGHQLIENGTIWQDHLGKSGYDVLVYDKRQGTTGPLALAGDLDAACDAVEKHFGKSRKIILWTAEQGTQVVLNSKCVGRAHGLVILSPIPDSLDRVWISGLREAGQRDRAESLNATFVSIRSGKFEPGAKIMGASLAFWKNWLELAENTPKQLENLKIPLLFIAGDEDILLGRYGRHVLEKIVKNRKNRQLIMIPKADRNLLQKEALSQTTVETILGALGDLEK